MLEMIDHGAYSKLSMHLWYLSERIVPLTLFSHRVDDKDRGAMAKTLMK